MTNANRYYKHKSKSRTTWGWHTHLRREQHKAVSQISRKLAKHDALEEASEDWNNTRQKT